MTFALSSTVSEILPVLCALVSQYPTAIFRLK